MTTDDMDDGKLASHIGARLQALRGQLGIPRAVAARALGVSAQAYANREMGTTEVKAVEIVILADLFQCDPATLFDGADQVWPGPDAGAGAAGLLADEVEEFLRQLARIRDPQVRRSVTEAVRALARAEDTPV